mmetsp:Transcript_70920/g.197050  ORF Transcript_70920/g.197050 Transcript_70920/m.197050 type:complete len:566 (-) Transcript_70920:33-1730(-)
MDRGPQVCATHRPFHAAGNKVDGVGSPAAALCKDGAIEEVLKELCEETFYWKSKQLVKEELIKPQHGATQSPATIVDLLRTSGLHAELKSHVYKRLQEMRKMQRQVERISAPGYPLPPMQVPVESAATLEVVEWARWRWGYLTLARLRELSKTQQQPFLRPRNPPQCDGRDSDEEVTTHHIVDTDNLYSLLTTEMRARSISAERAHLGLRWSSLGVQLHARSIEALREYFADLAPERDHLGVPDPVGGVRGLHTEAELKVLRQQGGRRLLAQPYTPQLQAFARFGVPPGLRRELWSKCLAVESTDMCQLDALQDVARGVCMWEWLTDDALRLDVAENCANDVCYHPFDEIVESMILALSRDPEVAKLCDCGMPQIPILAGADASSSASLGYVPPSGVVPFRCYSCYAGPFAFLADRLESAYPLFRAFYCRYLSRLHTVSCKPGTLLPLCALFESLVFTKVPDVSLHLVELGEEAAPLRIAFPWIVRAFVGFLRVDQVFWLWDRVLGFDSTEPIAMLAAAVFMFRAKLLLSARTAEDVQLVCSDLTELHALPLLQLLLEPDVFSGE